MIDETVTQIEEMQTQSASIVAVKAAEALRELTEREFYTVEEYLRSLKRNSGALHRASPSHATLYTTQRRIVTDVTESDPDTVEEAKERTLTAIQTVVTAVESSKDRAAERAATLIEDGDALLTHENSSTVMATLEYALDAGKQFELYVTESRPRFIGRKTARQLADRDGVAVTLITDSAAGHFLSQCDRVMVGMNCIIEETVYNRVGTYPIIATAAESNVPATVVGSSTKFIDSGFVFENEHRLASEVLLEPSEGFDVANPAYDATPVGLLETVVTDEQIHEY
ncbi:translation initiation factor eIF-2B [Natronococcus sp. A-GB7]|uniref:translation initiation factor eIF-2B n=1 Tax=Natronococcus sp. A-GB7 TaxID=3037649 RepID=UPI00241D1759|nr:translation initiation factor eIF-2B [Natronococcus sp. A-GB7]MDG5818407.1 translation initiation factor eIF-2B [Natronococcus sp. A-GB7]